MDEAQALALQGAEEGTVVVAKHQSAGRGRRGRIWEAAEGNISLTYITYQECSPGQGSQLSLVACVAIAEALRVLQTLPLLYKWPNDLLLKGKKVGGLLLECLSLPNSCKTAYLIGCGLNLKQHPHTVRYPTTSFHAEGIDLPYESCVEAIAFSLQEYLTLWKNEGFSLIRDLWMESAMGLGTPLSLDVEGIPQTGIFCGINEEGALLLKTSLNENVLVNGEIRAL